MQSMNKVILVGRLGKDPTIQYTPNGHAVCTLSVATNEPYKEGDQWKSRTEWHRVTFWKHNAEYVTEYAHKGQEILVEGKLQTKSYEDRESNQKKITEIVAQNVILFKGGERKTKPSSHNDDDLPF